MVNLVRKEVRILMLGLDAPGKTTILYKLKLGKVTTILPTLDFNVEIIEYKNFSFVVWDVCGSRTIHQLWRHYYPNAKAIIYVINSCIDSYCDYFHDYLDDVYYDIRNILNEDELRDCPLIIFANMQDKV